MLDLPFQPPLASALVCKVSCSLVAKDGQIIDSLVCRRSLRVRPTLTGKTAFNSASLFVMPSLHGVFALPLLLLGLSCLFLAASSHPPPFHSLSFFNQPPPYSALSADSPYLSQLSNGTYAYQTLDHFGWSVSAQRWSQRYLYSAEHWLAPSAPNGPGPIFLYAGNEGPIETFASNSGWMFELAASFNAMLVFVEHRFYGASMPWGDGNATLSYANVSTLSLLTSEQAIADYVQFVAWMRGGGHETEVSPFSQCRGNCSNIPVIVFGGSYGGMLAAWMRIKYPASVAGAIAASAPIWQFTGLTGPDVYNSIITRVYSSDTPQCSAAIKRSWSIIGNYSQTAAGLATLTSVFQPCNGSFTNATAHSLYDFLYSAISYMAMANYPYEANFLGPLPASPVSHVCRTHFAAANTTDDVAVLRAVAALANTFYNYTGQVGSCHAVVSGTHGPSTLGSYGLQGWGWQSCTEMVMPIGQYDATDMFWAAKWDMAAVRERCRQQYGVEPSENFIERAYGGVHIEGASRVLFSNGALDPWSGGGVNDSALGGLYSLGNTRGVVAMLMDNAAHHLDLRGSNATYDPASVQWVRQQQKLYIQAWLDNYDTPAEENATAGLDTKCRLTQQRTEQHNTVGAARNAAPQSRDPRIAHSLSGMTLVLRAGVCRGGADQRGRDADGDTGGGVPVPLLSQQPREGRGRRRVVGPLEARQLRNDAELSSAARSSGCVCGE